MNDLGAGVLVLAGAGEGRMPARLTVAADDKQFEVALRIDTPNEADYYRHGGILQYVLKNLMTVA